MAIFAGGTPETEHATYRDIGEVEINAGIFDVELVNGPGAVVTIDVTDIPQGFRVVQRERGGAVAVDIQGRNTWFFRVSGNPTVRVELPSGTNVDVQSASGDVAIETIRGTVRLRTSSGDIALDDIGGEAFIHSSSGDIRIAQGTGAFVIDTSSGDVRVRRFRGAMNVHTSSGDIDVAALRLTGDSVMASSSGDIEISLDNDLRDVTYVLKSNSGDLQFGTVRGEKHLSGGAGRFQIDASTSSGDISIR
jgi:DUF4097 and DUF4098 domain-containing protein YvlB